MNSLERAEAIDRMAMAILSAPEDPIIKLPYVVSRVRALDATGVPTVSVSAIVHEQLPLSSICG